LVIGYELNKITLNNTQPQMSNSAKLQFLTKTAPTPRTPKLEPRKRYSGLGKEALPQPAKIAETFIANNSQ
jgi:hypothetical protein